MAVPAALHATVRPPTAFSNHGLTEYMEASGDSPPPAAGFNEEMLNNVDRQDLSTRTLRAIREPRGSKMQ